MKVFPCGSALLSRGPEGSGPELEPYHCEGKMEAKILRASAHLPATPYAVVLGRYLRAL